MFQSLKKKLNIKLSNTQKLSLSFAILIIIGSILLSLPIMHYPSAKPISYLDHLFTTVSMVCVTGLSVFPIGEVYNGFGQTVCMILIQLGGLSLITLFSILTYSLKKKISLKDQEVLQSALNYDNVKDLKHYLFNVYKITFTIEVIAAVILMIDFIPRFGIKNGIFNSLFLAISAFSNAGFDNFSTNSLLAFQTNPIINLTVAFLIISGGLGFSVWINLIETSISYLKEKRELRPKFSKNLTLHTKLVLQTTGIILFIGTFLSLLLEFNNPNTIGNLNLFHKIMTSFFQTVTMRTAGFVSIDFTQISHATSLLYIIQMLIGGAPGSTAGGLKVTVFALLILMFRSELKGQNVINYKNHTIQPRLIRETLIILIYFFSILVLAFFLLLITESNTAPYKLFFEVSSALSTSGVTIAITSHLSIISKIIIMLVMFIGRVGPITVLLSMLQRKQKSLIYPKAKIRIG